MSRARGRSATGVYAGYVRVSTAKQDLGPEVQRARIEAKAVIMGSVKVEIIEERESAKTVNGRPKLTALLDRLDAGEFDGLIVAKLDRLSRNVADFLELVDRAQRNGWSLAVLDLDLDTTTAAGRLVATMFAAVAEWERGVISERTTAALAAKREKEPDWRPGRPVEIDQATTERILALRAAGLSQTAIADTLNAENVPTAQGKTWHRSTIAKVLARQAS